jgi:hypothetical protein
VRIASAAVDAPPHNVSTVVDARGHAQRTARKGAVIDGVLKVHSALGDKATQLGGMLPESLARLLMYELATRHTARML